MAKHTGRQGAGNPKRKTGVVRGRRALNAFRVDKEDVSRSTRHEERILEDDSDEGVKSEDDEDIDSDEAFDEEDEERFSTFKFSGSSSRKNVDKRRPQHPGTSDSVEQIDSEDDHDDDETYMDLSEMLADGQGTKGKSMAINKIQVAVKDSDDESEEEEEGSETSETLASDNSEEESEQDDLQLDSLVAFVDSLTSKPKEPLPRPDQGDSTPQTRIEASNDLSMDDILSSLTDPTLQTFRKSLAAQQTSKSKKVGQKLSVPLARPLQQKLEREAAYDETKAEISKWQPLVKANREADHLQFPTGEPQVNAKQSTSTLAGTFEPTTELERKVDEILRASGIKDEKEITNFEELALKKVSIDEVRLRQAELRAMRELMFRQDQKAKRIAKIKSKTYRRIHKREREREMERRMADEGFEGQDKRDEKLKMEAARAKERMTLRHKNTGDWARKMLSRGQHDLETRQAISEQVRRGDDLKKKIMGEEDENDDGDSSDSAEELENLSGNRNQWGDEEVDVSAERKGVMGMKFMRDAEERQKQANALELAEIQKATATGSDGDDDAVDAASSLTENPGRKTFTPGDQVEQSEKATAGRKQQEETGEEIVLKVVKNPFHMSNATGEGQTVSHSRGTSRMEPTDGSKNLTSNGILSKPSSSSKSPAVPEASQTVTPAENSWLAIPVSKQAKKQKPENRIEKIQKKRKLDEVDVSEALVDIDTSVKAVVEKLKTVADDPEDEDAPSMIYGRGKIAFNQIELINRAFAGDDLEADFIAEKEAVMVEDAPKEEDLTLPGWGSWTGLGVKRRATEKKLIKKIPGIDASKRKDAKLKNVIINEKKSKANTKYLVSGPVPYPYETREQYERSLSMPVGPEWTTREMYQKMTKPRVTITAGAVVDPLQAPFT